MCDCEDVNVRSVCRAKQGEGTGSTKKNQVSLLVSQRRNAWFTVGAHLTPHPFSLLIHLPLLLFTTVVSILSCSPSTSILWFRAYEKLLEEVDKCKAVLSACEQRDVKARQVWTSLTHHSYLPSNSVISHTLLTLLSTSDAVFSY